MEHAVSLDDSGKVVDKHAKSVEGLYRKVTWRLAPFLFLCYVVSYLDRVNVGFAKLQMMADLKLSDTVYGIGAGIFFLGYFIFEVPSNLIMSRTGARIWIARIMVTWGLISSAMMYVTSEPMFYLMRFLLGVAEAGFFPGVILYLTYWFPSERRGRIIAMFMTAIAFSGIIGGPLSGWIMQSFAGLHGLAGWQWLFLIEGVPSIIVGVWVLFYLDDSIADAGWLTSSEKDLLKSGLVEENRSKTEMSVRAVFANPKVWLLSLIYFCCIMGLYGIGFWLPQLIKAAGAKDVLQVGLLTAIPYGAAAIAMVLVSKSSDRSGERRFHLAVCAAAGAAGLILLTLFSHNIVMAMAALTLATMGILTTLPLFWTLPTAFLGGLAAAAGVAIINSVGNLAGFVSPYAIGAIKDATQSTDVGMYVLALSLCIGAVAVLVGIPRSMQR